MNTVMIFLVIVLVAAVILFSIIGKAAQAPRGRRGSSRTSSTAGPRLNRVQFSDRWSTIQAMAAGGGNGLRQAVSEADKLVDQALRQAGLPGDTMGDRLKAARDRFSDRSAYDALWRAHKLRNALAHEVGFDLVPSQAQEALRDFERALRNLGAL